MNYRSKIIGVGDYIPEKVYTNFDLEKMLDTSDEWITQRTGIKERHWVTPDQCTSDLALNASLAAIEDAGINKDEIDMIILATVTPDHEFPGTACFLQAKLDRPGVPAIDVRQQCTGFLYGLSMADLYIRSGQYKTILLVGAEAHSKGMDLTPNGRDMSVLFGDGAGAVILRRTEEGDQSQLYSHHLYADGAHAKQLWCAAPGSALPQTRITKEMMDEGMHFPYMNGKRVFVNAVKRISESIVEAATFNQQPLEAIDLLVLHQANQRITDMVTQTLKVDPAKSFNTIARFGNTTAATIPIGLSYAKKEGALKPGMLVCSAAFGSGFTWGASLYRW